MARRRREQSSISPTREEIGSFNPSARQVNRLIWPETLHNLAPNCAPPRNIDKKFRGHIDILCAGGWIGRRGRTGG